ncbi:MAG: HAMP domain-containing histidine kinase [Lachnospiraceae bacterium]|nr:HAMP domain-containing histidine kinase [Lachnospiraceae bacterium]
MKLKGMRSTYKRLNQMVDDAMNDSFEEEKYDETELSKLEVKWKRFLTSCKLSNKKIEEERSNIKEMVSDISHQIKTPLSNILLYSKLLEEQELSEESRAMVKEITKQSEKLDFLIQSLVKTSRLETGTFQLTPKSQDIFPVVKDALIQIEKKAEKKGIQILLDESEIPVVAFCDKKWTVEAVYNILDNAVKYSMEGTKIQIQVKNFEFFVGIEICDKGMGISEEEIPFIFQRFYRGKMVKEEEGVGIGLYLSRQIIEGQNGYIKVASKEGEGSVFSVFLPAGK